MNLFQTIKEINERIKTNIQRIISRKNKKPIHKKKYMAIYNYGVGGNEVKVDANEAIQAIQENKTLIASKLTTDDTYVPEIVENLKTVEAVFDHYKPNVSVQQETPEGTIINENFNFNNLADFTPKKLIENSKYLNQLNIEKEQYNKILRQLRNNKILNKIAENEPTKQSLIDTLKDVIKELEKER